MASREPINLVFGEDSFKIRPLTFKQVQALSERLAKPIGEGDANVAQMMLARDAIEIALSRDHADVSLDDMECDIGRLPEQMLDIMKLGGFGPREDATSGEASAAAARQDGGTSEAG